MNKEQQKWLKDFNSNEYALGMIAAQFNACSVEEWQLARASQDINLIGEILQRAWENAPDKRWIHEIYCWGLLCDLCSDYCFGDRDE